MVLGRSFVPEEFIRHEQTAAPRVIVLSSHLWRTAFGGNPDIVGRSVQFSGRAAPIVGVASPAYDTITTADAWFNVPVDRRNISPLVMTGITEGVIAPHLRPSTTIWRRSPPGSPANFRSSTPIACSSPGLSSTPSSAISSRRLIIAFAGTALLLVIACVNVTNLLLARGTTRTREIAVRAALGASRAALVRYILLEGLILSGIGGLIGVVVARGGVRMLLLLAQSRLPRLDADAAEPVNPLRVYRIAATLQDRRSASACYRRFVYSGPMSLRCSVTAGAQPPEGAARSARSPGWILLMEMALAVTLNSRRGIGSSRIIETCEKYPLRFPGATTPRRGCLAAVRPLSTGRADCSMEPRPARSGGTIERSRRHGRVGEGRAAAPAGARQHVQLYDRRRPSALLPPSRAIER